MKKKIVISVVLAVLMLFFAACENGGEKVYDTFMEYGLAGADPAWSDELEAAVDKLIKGKPADESSAEPYALALFDLNCDGTPELISAEAGGSSGGVLYAAYDIKTGELVSEFTGGIFHGDQSDAWCVYYHVESGECKNIGRFTTSGGSDILNSQISELVYDADNDKYSQNSLFSIDYEIEEEIKDDGTIVEKGTSAKHFFGNESVSAAEYNDQYDLFVSSYIRIPETGMKLIKWADVEDKGNNDKSAENMVDALLASGQKFPTKIK